MEIRNDVAHVLVRQGLARTNLLPVRVAKIRASSDDDAPQTLIAYKGQIVCVSDLLLPLLVAGRTASSEDVLSMFDIAYSV
jgi:hypothetical protein